MYHLVISNEYIVVHMSTGLGNSTQNGYVYSSESEHIDLHRGEYSLSSIYNKLFCVTFERFVLDLLGFCAEGGGLLVFSQCILYAHFG